MLLDPKLFLTCQTAWVLNCGEHELETYTEEKGERPKLRVPARHGGLMSVMSAPWKSRQENG